MVKPSVILIVDDELHLSESVKRLSESKNFEILTATTGREALSLVKRRKSFDLIVLDVHLPDMMEHSVMSQIKCDHPHTPVIFITDDATLDYALSAFRCGAYDYLRKPFEPDELIRTVENALIQKNLQQEKVTLDKELSLSEERYRYLVQNSPDMIYTLDAKGHFTFLNDAVEQLLRYSAEDLLGKHYSMIVCEEDLRKADFHFNERRRGSRATSGLELRLKVNRKEKHRFKGNDFVTVELKAMGIHQKGLTDENKDHVGTHGVVRDISKRKRLQAQLQKAERLDSLGTLAGGIAHDFNNLLMGIQGRSNLISMDLEKSHPHLEHIQAIDECIRSARELTSHLLGFARGGKCEVKPNDLNRLVIKMAKMFGRTNKDISIHTHIIKQDVVVESDQRQIEQVLLNLFVNAWQAMPNGGELYLRTTIAILDKDFCTPYQLEPGAYAHVSVTDTGMGMEKKILRRIFEPFFTTKEKNRGTGLGLASAYGIIKNHGGAINVYSELGHGTTFNIYMPLSEKASVHENLKNDTVFKGTETVLVVDDEKMVLEVCQKLLGKLGYRVLTAVNGYDAIKIIKQIEAEIELVILDMIMPGTSGGKLFDQIREIRPELKTMLSSGYAIEGKARAIMQRGCNGFIQKPFNLSELSKKIREILDDGFSQQ